MYIMKVPTLERNRLDNVKKQSFIQDFNNSKEFPTKIHLLDKYDLTNSTFSKLVDELTKEGETLIDRSKRRSSVEKWCPYCGGKCHKRGQMTSGGVKKPCYACTICKKKTTKPLDTEVDIAEIIDERKVNEAVGNIKNLKKQNKTMRYVITSVQNNTKLNSKFFKSIISYCNHNNAVFIAVPILYRNPTRDTDLKVNDYWYPPEIREYLINKQVVLNKNITVMGDVKIQATAADPLVGLDNISGTKSAIYAHGQMRMRCIATPQDKLPKVLYTTGSMSIENYSETKAGAKGKFHHTNSALVVECVGGRFHPRELSCDKSGGFYDLDKYYSGDEISDGYAAEAVVLGDEHIMFMDGKVKKCTFTDKGSMVNILKPKNIVRHDSIDAYSINHHHKGNRITQYVKAVTGANDLRLELDQFVEHINHTTPSYAKSIIVSSNHNDAITRWLHEYNPDRDPYNALIYHELSSKVFASAKFTEHGVEHDNPIEAYSRGKMTCEHEFIRRSKSYMIKGISVDQHGDKGVNGSRGSAASFAKGSYKCIVGHSHSPEIKYGCYVVGTSSNLKLEYNHGWSSWMQTHAIIYPNGERTLVHIIDGHWRA